jgi:DNA-binding TFAR19-related protein (PDSD5 family)
MAEKENNDELLQQITMLEAMAKKNMSKEAIARYGNLKMAHPETAIKAIALIAQASQLNQISQPLNDNDFRELLIEIQKGKTNYSFRR